MAQIGKIKVLFIAGFGPIIWEDIASRDLYHQTLGISFKEEKDGYLHTEVLKGAKTFALWPLGRQRSPALARIVGPLRFLHHKLGLSLTLNP